VIQTIGLIVAIYCVTRLVQVPLEGGNSRKWFERDDEYTYWTLVVPKDNELVP
jgi:hypothetical protein